MSNDESKEGFQHCEVCENAHHFTQPCFEDDCPFCGETHILAQPCPQPVGGDLPDSGARSEYETGAVRDSSEGKGCPHMIPPVAIRKMAKRFEDGARKYAKHNWMRGIPLSHYQDSTMRHLMQWSEGDESEDHLGAALWNLACVAWTEEAIKNGELPSTLDDLPFRQLRADT